MPWIPDSRCWIPDFMSVELRFCQIPCRWNLHSIPDSNRQRDQSKAQDFGFLKQTYFLRFRNPDYLSWSEVFFTNAIISIFFKFYTDCVYGWAKLIKNANLMLNWFLLFSVSRWWHLVYMKSMLHPILFSLELYFCEFLLKRQHHQFLISSISTILGTLF